MLHEFGSIDKPRPWKNYSREHKIIAQQPVTLQYISLTKWTLALASVCPQGQVPELWLNHK